jgi:non-ribosomal peptide synthetase component F
MLALRTDLSGDPSFRVLLRRVREACLGAYAHQELPFEKLVKELQPERDPARAPFFHVAFGLQNAPMSKLEARGLTLCALAIERDVARFDLTVWMTETVEGLKGVWTYNSDLFNPQTIRRMQSHYKRLLQTAAANPDGKLSQLSMFTDTEDEQQMVTERELAASDYIRFKKARSSLVRASG